MTMESNKATIGALFFILLVAGTNVVMYGVVRSIIHSSRKGTNFFEAMGNMFNPSNQKKDDTMEELRKKVEELNGEKKD